MLRLSRASSLLSREPGSRLTAIGWTVRLVADTGSSLRSRESAAGIPRCTRARRTRLAPYNPVAAPPRATERAAREVTRPVPPLAGPEDIARKIGSEEAAKRKAPARAPEAPRSPRVPAGVPSEAELRDKTPAQLQEIANITRGQGDYPGRELTLHVSGVSTYAAADRSSKDSGDGGADDNRDGPEAGYGRQLWALAGSEGPARGRQSREVRSRYPLRRSDATPTESTLRPLPIINRYHGCHYHVSNNNRLRSTSEAPAATDIAARRSARRASYGTASGYTGKEGIRKSRE